ncbi:MAG: stage V sporulation protein AC [Tumebacillaceae bacterium]
MKQGPKAQADYQKLAKKHTPKKPVLRNSIRAFLVGGLICLIGQFVQSFFISYCGFSKETAGNPTVAVMIFIATVLTALGVYDRIGQWAGAGSAVPVTGFANSMASAAMEHRSEGIVAGVGGQMFKIGGTVIVFGTVAAFIIAIIKQIITMIS